MNDAHDEDGVDWFNGKIIWPPPTAENGPRFNIASTEELVAFLPIAVRDDYFLMPSEFMELIKQAAALGVFVDVHNVPADHEYIKHLKGHDEVKREFDLLKIRTFKSIAAQLGASPQTQDVAIPEPKNIGSAGQRDTTRHDTKDDTPKKPRKKRPMSTAAADCARLYRADQGKTPMNAIIEDYVTEFGGSIAYIMRILNDNPDQWKRDTDATF